MLISWETLALSMFAFGGVLQNLVTTTAALLHGVWPYLVMLLGFSVIVFVHELGHFSVAKWAGVRVDRFAIGFGREIFGFTRGETRYSFNILPLGGYVKMLGQEDFDDKSKELEFKEDPRSFINKPVGRRMAIVSAGVIMNAVFACLLFMLVFMIGMEAIGPRIAYVEPDSPAERAGILPGDIVRKINGENILEFREVSTAVMLAPLHEPIEFVVERNGQLRAVTVKPEYMVPDNTRDARRQIVGITPGVTPEILVVGPEIDQNRPDHPHVGDVLVEIDGVPITKENASQMIHMIAYAKGDVFVERKDPKSPTAPPQRVKVEIPPILTMFPNDDSEGSIGVLGLSPLVKFSSVDPRGRAYLANIEVGDTVVEWADVAYPTRQSILRAVHDAAERDIHFKVKKRNGRVYGGFVRPKQNPHGPATIQAMFERISDASVESSGPLTRLASVRRLGRADEAVLEAGDVVLTCLSAEGPIENPTVAEVNRIIRKSPGRQVALSVRKTDGQQRTVWVEPEPPGAVDATVNLVADDTLRVAAIIPALHGVKTAAAQAGVPAGALITSLAGNPVSRWRELIDAFREHAGKTVDFGYKDVDGAARSASFRIPHCLPTLLGVGPEARIVSIDGRRTVILQDGADREEVSVGYRKGMRAILSELAGRKQVPVEYRENPLAEIKTAHVDVTEEMIDPWLYRVSFSANIDVGPEVTLLKGENALDAVRIGLHKTYYFCVQVYRTMERMFFTRSVGWENVSGPLGIIDLGGKVARAGLVEFIFFMAIISANLAVINFLPLPIVDGGLMVFLIIEKIKGSPVSLRVQVATQMIGLFLIIGTFLLVTFNDAMRLWG